MEERITCTACQVSISNCEYRNHYKSDIHRINLKRKISGLGPLTAEEVERRVQALQETREAGCKKEKQTCSTCNKKFSSKRALENHTKSRRHQQALARAEKLATGVDDCDSVSEDGCETEVEEELRRRIGGWQGGSGMYSGIFDDSWHGSWDDCLGYVKKRFGLFVPYEEYVKDMEGLLKYLGEKVGIGYACICCDRGFGSGDAARRHMKDVGHRRMGEAWVEEFGEFYRMEDDGWAVVEGSGDEEEEEEMMIQGVEEGMEVVERLDNGDDDDVALVMNGKIVGHRSLLRYYKQGAGRRIDDRVCVKMNRNGMVMNSGKIRDKGAMMRVDKEAVRRKQKFEVVVGGKNYYTRKARFKQKMAVFNSGYRA